MIGDQGHRRGPTKRVRVWVERDPIRFTLDPQPRIELDQRRCEPLEIRVTDRWADIDVNCGVARSVKTGGNTSDHDELDVVLEQRLADQRDGSSSISGDAAHGVTHQAIALLSQAIPRAFVQCRLPLRQHGIVIVGLDETEPKLHASAL